MKSTLILLITLFVFPQAQEMPEVNKKIIAFCDKNMGKKVGKGECWDLAAEALNSSGAKWTPPYDFGKELNTNKEVVLSGDIIQFEKVKLVYPDGSWKEFPQHTAVIYKVIGKNHYTIAEQNSNRKRFVILSDVDMNHLKKGKYSIFRPQAN